MKDLLRMQNLQKRNSLCTRDLGEKSVAIKEKLFSLPEFQGAEKILFFVEIGNEVRTNPMILEALARGKIIAVPKSDFANRTMQAIQIDSLDVLEKTKIGLFEPKTGEEIPAMEIDLIIVPGVAFDAQGHRLGFGKGFFDKFLRGTRREACKIALSFECNIEESVPYASHDALMNKIITEERIICV